MRKRPSQTEVDESRLKMMQLRDKYDNAASLLHACASRLGLNHQQIMYLQTAEAQKLARAEREAYEEYYEAVIEHQKLLRAFRAHRR